MSVSRQMVAVSFGWFKLADALNLFPIKLEFKRGKYSHSESQARRIFHNIFFILSCIKSLHLAYAVARVLIDGSVTAVAIIIALWGGLTFLSTFWSYEMFHRRVSETTLLFNSLDIAKQRYRNLINYGTEEKSFLMKLLRMNQQEQFLIMLPIGAITFLMMYLTLMLELPQWSIFATSLLPSGSRAFLFWIFACLECTVAFTTATNLVFLFFLELALQVTRIGGLDAVLQGISRTRAQRRRDYDSDQYLTSCIDFLQEIYVLVTLCNILFKRILFTGKLSALNCTIFGTYYVLSHYLPTSQSSYYF